MRRTIDPLTIALFLAILVLAGTAAPVCAGESAGEYQIKAAFLYNFAKFVEWPESAFDSDDSPIRIGILGKDPFGEILDKAIEGKKINGRRIEIVRSSEAEGLSGSHIVFFPAMEEKRFQKSVSGADLYEVLTICDTSSPDENDCIISFVLEDGKIRFDISNILAKESGIKISSKLLRLGRIVED